MKNFEEIRKELEKVTQKIEKDFENDSVKDDTYYEELENKMITISNGYSELCKRRNMERAHRAFVLQEDINNFHENMRMFMENM